MDDQKNKILIAVIAFNLVVILYMGYRWMAVGLEGFSVGDFLIAFVLGGVVAGGALTFAMLKK